MQKQECAGGDQGGGGSRENPCTDDASCHAPPNRGEPGHASDTHDGACDRMRGADGNAGEGGSEKRNRTGAFGAESTERFELRDLLAHGVDDSPSTKVSPG